MPYWRAFCRLGRRRPVGLAPGPIEMQAISAYFAIYEIRAVEDRDRYLDFLDALDGEFLRLTAEQRER